MKKYFSKTLKWFRNLGARDLLLFVVIATLGVLVYQNQKIDDHFLLAADNRSSLVTETGQLKDVYSRFGEDINEMRQYLSMPRKNYGSFDDIFEEDLEPKNSTEIALFEYVSGAGIEAKLNHDNKMAYELLAGLKNSQDFAVFLKEKNLHLSGFFDDEMMTVVKVKDFADREILEYRLKKEDGSFLALSLFEERELERLEFEDFLREEIEYLDENKSVLIRELENYEKLSAMLSSALANEDLKKYMADNGLSVSEKDKVRF
ncbi:hypothetical protein KJ632_03010, partial [Patescibacteria group bacterium]|nr:hypothetical protein [Patescibacteria group bacterium]